MAKSGIYAFGVIYQTKVVYVYQDKIGHVEKGKISIWVCLSIFRVAGSEMHNKWDISKIEELMDIYETLVDAGVTFYYEDEEISHGEVTSLTFNEDDTVDIELDESENFTVEVKDFINNHSKEGMNYHCFETVRKFDKLLS